MKINKFYSPYLLICLSALVQAAAPKQAATPPPSLASLQAEGVGSGQMIILGQPSAANSASSLNDGNAAAAAAGGQATPERSQSLPHLQVLGAAAAAQPEGPLQKSLGTLLNDRRGLLRNQIVQGPHTPRSGEVFKKDLELLGTIGDLLQYLDLDLDTKKKLMAAKTVRELNIQIPAGSAEGAAKK
jgi:hypothetical protein